VSRRLEVLSGDDRGFELAQTVVEGLAVLLVRRRGKSIIERSGPRIFQLGLMLFQEE